MLQLAEGRVLLEDQSLDVRQGISDGDLRDAELELIQAVSELLIGQQAGRPLRRPEAILRVQLRLDPHGFAGGLLDLPLQEVVLQALWPDRLVQRRHMIRVLLQVGHLFVDDDLRALSLGLLKSHLSIHELCTGVARRAQRTFLQEGLDEDPEEHRQRRKEEQSKRRDDGSVSRVERRLGWLTDSGVRVEDASVLVVIQRRSVCLAAIGIAVEILAEFLVIRIHDLEEHRVDPHRRDQVGKEADDADEASGREARVQTQGVVEVMLRLQHLDHTRPRRRFFKRVQLVRHRQQQTIPHARSQQRGSGDLIMGGDHVASAVHLRGGELRRPSQQPRCTKLVALTLVRTSFRVVRESSRDLFVIARRIQRDLALRVVSLFPGENLEVVLEGLAQCSHE
mmetsp:Transcript_9659/g.36266  ORF Transcript_9659/g.36266 Transcript_9659/m.36266 type:complete len:395 (+) Transcript_9659:460-1644(+)